MHAPVDNHLTNLVKGFIGYFLSICKKEETVMKQVEISSRLMFS
jgi:hypothetical protein